MTSFQLYVDLSSVLSVLDRVRLRPSVSREM